MEPGLFVLNRTGLPLQAPDGGICIDADHQSVAKVMGIGEVVDMAIVKDVKATVGENDPLALRFPVGYGVSQLCTVLNL